MRINIVSIFFLFLLILPTIQAETRLLRYPDIYGDKIVFVYGGDLWTVSSQGGVAHRLTSHPGLELFPKFSPDGKWIAFSAEYDGTRAVYVMPSEGGEPKRLTFRPSLPSSNMRRGYDCMVLDWFPDGKNVLFRSWQDCFDTWFEKLYKVPVDGGFPQTLPLPEGGLASFSSDGTKIAYTPIFRDFRTWKRYRGGLAQDVWTYDFTANKSQRITSWEGTDHCPMWHENSIYFVSDRNGRSNIFRYDTGTGETSQITNHAEYDIKWPGFGPEAIVYENGGWLYVLDFKTHETRKVTIDVPCENLWARPRLASVSDRIGDYAISPKGKKALVVARGELFGVPVKGTIANLSKTPGAREKHASFSPNGKWICYVSDISGEDEIYLLSTDKNEKTQLTQNGDRLLFKPLWSPDSKKLVFSDKSHRLFYIEIESKLITQIDHSPVWEIHDYVWSPDSRYIAYSKEQKNMFSTIFIYSFEKKNKEQITSFMTNSHSPAFDPEGKYLYFISRRAYQATMDTLDYNFISTRNEGVYVIPLKKDLLSPFIPEEEKEEPEEEAKKEESDKKDSTEEKKGTEEKKDGELKKDSEEKKGGEAKKDSEEKKDGEAKKDEAKKDGKKEEEKVKVEIDFENIEARTVALPIAADNYGGLSAIKGNLFYMSLPDSNITTEESENASALHRFNMKERKAVVFLEKLEGYDISADGEKLIYKSDDVLGIVETGGTPKVGDGKLDLQGMQVKIEPALEWKQMFGEAWRYERDYFYVPNMHGVDWKAVRKQYEVLLPYISHRDDLTYIIGEMIGELACSHTYVGGGDYPPVTKVATGLLGAILTQDSATGYYRFAKIYSGHNWDKDLRSPLTMPGLHVKEGDYLFAIGGVEVKSPVSPYSLLEGTVGKSVELKVGSEPDLAKARTITIQPIANEMPLCYLDWVKKNREYVDKATGGKLGYIHIPNMSDEGVLEFIKQYYAQIRKEGLIVDVRYNGGGSVSQILLEKLRRVVMSMAQCRNGDKFTYPDVCFHGPMVCLINCYSASDGDIFPYFFREYKIGKLIGKRTWGGVVGIRGSMPLMDGGYVTVSEFGIYGLNGQWIIENKGVEPDIDLDNLPEDVVNGKDAQLDKAISHLLEQIQASPKTLPDQPVPPIK